MTEPLTHAPTASAPVADTPSGTAPATRIAAAPWGLLRDRALWDWAATALLGALALVLASAPARNTDVWMHLATGRALWAGEAGPTVDPFAYTTAGIPWTNPCWLYDLAAYGVYTTLGSAGLVAVKAFAIVLLAVVLLAVCWRGPVRWLAVLSVAIALVAMGPYLELRPIGVSYLLLGFTLYWLVRVGRRAEQAPPLSVARAFLRYLPLLLLFAVWANLDRWFVLGPAVLVLWWLGALVHHGIDRGWGATPSYSPAHLRGLGLAALVGLVTLLASPHHVRPLTVLPALLAEHASAPAEAELLVPGVGMPPASLAYCLLIGLGLFLIGLGLFAFFFQGARFWWSDGLVWSAMLALSLYDKAAIPFFAVIAGPIAGLHLQAAAARRLAANEASATPRGRATGLLQLATLLVLIAALATAWPGWLQGTAAEPRAWEVVLDPSLAEASARLARWHDAGLKVGRGFQFSTSSADAVAWLCPQEKGFLDDRPGLFPDDVLAEDAVVKQGLLGSGDADWRSILRARQVTHVIVYDTVDRRLMTVLQRMFAAPREWRPIYLRGRTVIFAWVAAEQAGYAGDLPQLPTVDLSARAFQPGDEQKPLVTRPPQMSNARTWADAFIRPAMVPNLGRGEALVYLAHFESQRPAYLRANQVLLESALGASAVGLAAPVGDPPAALVPGCGLRCGVLEASQRPLTGAKRLAPGAIDLLTGQLIAAWLTQRDRGPPASALLAVRAARRAVQESPDDAVAYLLLGQAYLRLMRDTSERKALATAPAVARVREAQVAAALNQALRLQPELLPAHEALTAFHQESGHLDLALQHLRAQLAYVRTMAARFDTTEALSQRLARLEETERQLANHVNDLTLLVQSRSFQRDVVRQAQFAQDQGLPGLALDMLRRTDSATLGRSGTVLKLQLALIAGQAQDLRQELEPPSDAEQVDATETLDFCWLRAQLSAAEGAYREADDELETLTIEEGISVPEFRLSKAPLGTVVAFLVGRSVLDQAAPQLRVVSANTVSLPGDVEHLVSVFRRQADIACLRGLLAIEAGEARKAVDLFRSSLARWESSSDGAALLSRHYLALLGQQGKRGGP
jgi:hypothetical protein